MRLMAPTIEPSNPPAENLTVRGTLPAGLTGQLIGIGPDVAGRHGVVHSIELNIGRVTRYRSRAVHETVGNVITFGGSILALGNGTPAYELTSDLATLCRVDLAGQGRGLAAFPKHDPLTGELHLLAVAATGDQAYVVVSAGALTRRSRPIAGANRPVDLAITGDHVVFVADGFVGVAARDSDAAINWITTGTAAPLLVHANDAGDSVVALAVTPSLERWTLHPASGAIHRDVLDQTPRRFARLAHHLGEMPQFVWMTGDHTVDKHDLGTAKSTSHRFHPERTPSDFAFVADPARADNADGGWLVGFVHQAPRNETDLVVLDAADVALPPIATARIPRRIPRGLHSTWIPRPNR
jgi:carotenoid cleavage dioxygenase-like enzyme